LIIEPLPGEPDVDWNLEQAQIIRLELETSGNVIATVTSRTGTKTEKWLPGGACPICNGVSPTGYEACPDGTFRPNL
jgi:hypothetical protein